MKLKSFWAAVTILTLMSVALLQATMVQAQTTSFPDTPETYEYSDAVNYLKDQGVVEGYEDGTYKPLDTINRAEFLKIILVALSITPEGSQCFPDLYGEWYDPYVCKAQLLGYVQGYPDLEFKAERPINAVEAAKIVSLAFGVEIDESQVEEWFHKFVEALESEQAIPPTIGTFDQYINRGEMAEMIWRVQTDQSETSQNYDDMKQNTDDQQMHTIASCNELQDKFEAYGIAYDRGYGVEEMDMIMAPATAGEAKEAEAPAAANGAQEAGVDYSTTNIQVEGVDEADIVKSDGEYIYIVKADTVRIVKAYPPEEMVEMDAIEFGDPDFHPQDMYVDGNKLVVIGNSYFSYPYPLREEAMTVAYPYYGGDITKIYILDITDKSNIDVFRKLEFEGNYSQSRKVDEMVYVVLNRYGFWAYDEVQTAEEIVPRYLDTNDVVAQPLVDCMDVKYVPIIESPNYLIVAGIPIDDESATISKEVVLGSSDNIYASREHMYVASSDWRWDTFGGGGQSTQIYKFDLDRNNVDFLGQGKVPGSILNQFSMDEHDNHFRIATTRGFSWEGSSDNNVYVLDSEMNLVGDLEGIAPGESIYSTRFIGDRLYMVTFKKIDPFFVIDMSDHRFPKILGKLKIPGYSDYLHPYDENHILGFGKETIDPEEWETMDFDFAWFQGMKVAMFDVSDVENPVQKFKVIIGDRGTESPVMYDHKALLFDREKGLLAFPVTVAEIPEGLKDPDLPTNTYGDYVFQGAYVYNVTLEDGFDLLATITHYSPEEVADKAGYYWYGEKDIERVMYIGDFLYTVSMGMVKANDMTAEYDEVNAVEVGGETGGFYYIE